MADDGRIEKALERVRSARADYEAKQDDVHQARERYYDAVRTLNETGMSLREVAEALGLSHQRVHQMVGESTDTSSKLGRAARKAAKAGGALLLVGALAGVAVWAEGMITRTSRPVAQPTQMASVDSPSQPEKVETAAPMQEDSQVSCHPKSGVCVFHGPGRRSSVFVLRHTSGPVKGGNVQWDVRLRPARESGPSRN